MNRIVESESSLLMTKVSLQIAKIKLKMLWKIECVNEPLKE